VALGKAVYRIVATGSGKGKTSLGVGLVKELSARGYKVAVVKHASRGLDVEGKDTRRYAEAGARIIVASSPSETMIMLPEGVEDLDLLAPLIPSSIFIVLVEGFRHSRRGKKIIVAEEPGELEELGCSPRDTLLVVSDNPEVIGRAEEKGCAASRPEDIEVIAGRIAGDAVEEALKMLPGADCRYCGYPTCRMFAEHVARGGKTLADCPLITGVEVVVDGVRVPLNPYVRSVFRSMARALVSTLKGVPENPRSIVIRVEEDGEKRGG